MKKNYMLLSAGLIISSFGFSQGVAEKFAKDEIPAIPSVDRSSDADRVFSKSKVTNAKVFRDTAFYEDFDSTTFVGNGWTITNNNTNNAVWQNTGVFTPGQFSGGTPAIGSTTASNGFMLLNGDLVNTPIPNPIITMDTWFTSDTIWLSGANATTPINPNTVWVSYQQYLRYCCSSANQLVLEVSTDGTAWTTYDATDAIAVNAANAGTANPVANNEINITGAVCGASYIFVRFRSTGNSHYFWMIDDFAVIEGPKHELALSGEHMEFNVDSFTFNPFYRRIPIALFPPLPFFGSVTNNGELNETNVAIDVDVRNVLDTAGNPGQGLVYSTSAVIGNLTSVCDTSASNSLGAMTPTPRFIPLGLLGSFEVDYKINYDSVALEELPANDVSSSAFITSDTVYQRDDDVLGGGTGPHRYTIGGTPGGTAAGDRFGLTYTIEKSPMVTLNSQMIPTSISYFVNGNTRNIGVEIIPKIWRWDEDSASVNSAFVGEVASSFIPYVVAASDTNSVLTLGLDNGSAVSNGLDSGQYVVGWEVTSIAGNTTFEVYNDASTAALQKNVTAFLYLGHAPASGWGWVDVNPAIRLNMGNLPTQSTVGISDIAAVNKTQFYVGPNPNNGIFEVRIQNKQANTYNMNVRNMLGQSVYFDVVGVNGQQIVNMDLSSVDKGVYFVTLENSNERLVKKVVIK